MYHLKRRSIGPIASVFAEGFASGEFATLCEWLQPMDLTFLLLNMVTYHPHEGTTRRTILTMTREQVDKALAEYARGIVQLLFNGLGTEKN